MKDRDYSRDIADIRSMMERSSKFLSLSGWAGVMAGIYAVAGVLIANLVYHYGLFNFTMAGDFYPLAGLGISVLLLSLSSAAWLSQRKAVKRSEKAWNPTSRRLLTSVGVPLVSGGLLMILLILKDSYELVLPLSLIFYGIALYNAGKFSYEVLKTLGFLQIALGLTAAWNPDLSLLFWGIGFGLLHIIYGLFMLFKYER